MSNKFRYALVHSFIGKYTILAFQFILSLIIARLLAPDEFGLYAVALVFANLAELLRNFGVTNYIVKEKELTIEKLESSLTILILTVLFTSLLQFSIAEVIGKYYESEQLTLILKILSFNLVIKCFGAITYAQLVRDMRIKELNTLDIPCQIIGGLSSLYLAYDGYGVFALVYGFIISNLLNVIGLQFFKYKLHPKKLGFSHLKEIMSFSSFVIGANLIGHLGNSSQDWILGKSLGMESVGIYNRGLSTVGLYDRLVTGPLNLLIAPVFSEKSRKEEEVVQSFIKLSSIQVSISWPFLLVIAYFSEPIVLTLYGEQWKDVAHILVWICIAKMLMVTTQSANNFLLGLGNSKTLFHANILIQTVQIISILVSMPYGLFAVVISSSLSTQIMRLIVYISILKVKLGINIREYIVRLIGPMFVALVTATSLLLFDRDQFSLFTMLMPLTVVTIWLLLSFVFKLDISNEISLAYRSVVEKWNGNTKDQKNR